jgi:hypothetical protein
MQANLRACRESAMRAGDRDGDDGDDDVSN